MPTALIVDDSPIMRAQLRSVLTCAGFQVLAEAGNANDLETLYERLQPDLVSIDIVMPGRDGAAAAAALLTKHPEAVVVMCTSLTSRAKIAACHQAGVSDYLLKPFNADQAATIFRGAVERRRAATR